MIWIYVFLAINLLIRVPIRIAIRCFKVRNDKLYTADSISMLAAGFCFIGMCIHGLISSKIDIGLAVACIVLFGGLLLFLSGVWIYAEIKEQREKNKNKEE